MDQTSLDEYAIFISANAISTSENKCEISVEYPKPIQLNRQMECALVKMSVPPKLYAVPFDEDLKIHLYVQFFDHQHALEENINYDGRKLFHFQYNVGFNNENLPQDSQELISKLKSINTEINTQMKTLWGQRYKNTQLLDWEENKPMSSKKM